MVKGTVIGGQGYEHKVPTANIRMLDPGHPEGVWFGVCWRGDEQLGPCACWILPHAPGICETYIAGWDGTLYGDELTIKDLRPVSRDEMRKLYDKVLINE